jgi:hypothetical protein
MDVIVAELQERRAASQARADLGARLLRLAQLGESGAQS